jgi:hypothetical protein
MCHNTWNDDPGRQPLVPLVVRFVYFLKRLDTGKGVKGDDREVVTRGVNTLTPR